MKFILPFFIFLVLSSCSNEQARIKSEKLAAIDSLEKEMFESINKQSDALGTQMYEKYLDFADSFPEDSDAPEYLFRAANMARAIKMFPEAIGLYQRIIDSYPDYKNAVPSAFLIAFVHDNDLNTKDKARALYEQFIKDYPDSKFAQDASERLKTLHMTDEELMKHFEELSKARQDSLLNAAN